MQTLGLCPALSGPISSAFLFNSSNFPVPGLIIIFFSGCPPLLSQLLRSFFFSSGSAPFQTGAGTGCVNEVLPACLLESKQGRCPGKEVARGIPGGTGEML